MQPKRDTLNSARGRWRDILLSLGVDAMFLQNRHCACPLCGGKDRYRFSDRQGKGDWYCNQCGPGDGMDLLQRLNGWGFGQAANEIDRVIGTARLQVVRDKDSEDEAVAKIKRVLGESKAVIQGDPVWTYLNKRTGIVAVPKDIRFHPNLWHAEAERKFPAMLAIMRYPDLTGASVHRTYLTEAGEKAPVSSVKKIMTGRPLNASCVRLSPPASSLGIAEGIETALAASVRFGVPVWAATTAGLLEKWEPPKEASEIVVCGDNDTSYTGQAAAYVLAKRLVVQGFRVTVEIPEFVGKDFADLYG